MNIPLKFIAAAFAGIMLALSPAVSHAETVYFLVGVRHVYRIGPDRDAHLADREEIEKNYADGIAADQDVFNRHVQGGADRDKESEMLNADLDALADARDKSLGAIFEQCDSIRDGHPELRIQGDGPYQVIGIDMHEDNGVVNYDRYIVYAPWPDYVAVGGCYGGWDYGVWYTPGLFFDLYLGWFDLWPGGRYWGGFWGHGGPFAFSPHGFNDRWHGGHGGGFGHTGYAGGYTHSATAAGYSRSASGGYSHSAGSSAYTRGATAGGYTHSGRSVSSAGYGHSPASSYSRSSGSSGYSHGYSGTYSRTSGSRSYSASGIERSGSTGGSRFSRASYDGSSYRGSASYGGGSSYGGGASYGSRSAPSRNSGSSGRGGSSGRSSGSSGRGR